MSENNSDNPFQSPLPSEPVPNRPPFPAKIFWGMNSGLLLLCLLLLFTVRGLGIVAFFFVIPGMLRGFLMIQRERKQPTGQWGPTQLIYISLLLMIPLYLAASLGFGITCFAAVIAFDSIPGLVDHGNHLDGLLWGVLVGLGAGAMTFALMFWLSLTYRGTSREGNIREESNS